MRFKSENKRVWKEDEVWSTWSSVGLSFNIFLMGDDTLDGIISITINYFHSKTELIIYVFFSFFYIIRCF